MIGRINFSGFIKICRIKFNAKFSCYVILCKVETGSVSESDGSGFVILSNTAATNYSGDCSIREYRNYFVIVMLNKNTLGVKISIRSSIANRYVRPKTIKVAK